MDGWILFEICVNLFQGALMVYFMRRHVHACRGNRLTDAACTAAVGLFFTAHQYFAFSFTDAVVFLLPMAYAFYFSDDAWYFKIFWSLILAAISCGVITAVLLLFMAAGDAEWPELMARTGMRLAYVGTSNASLALVIFLLSRHPRPNGTLSWTALGIFIALNGAFLFAIEQMFAIRTSVPEAGLHFILANACLLGCLFLSLLLYEILSAYAEKQEEAESEIRTLQLTHQYNAEIQEMYAQMLAWRHDAKNQIATMRAMIEQGGLKESAQFWKAWQKSAPAMPRFSTGCLAVDALLTTKALSMQKAGVDFHFVSDANCPPPMDISDFCAALANLLDNASEAAQRAMRAHLKGYVKLRFTRVYEMFYLYCDNSMAPGSLRRKRHEFLTTKEGTGHGVGIRTTRKIVYQADGRSYFEPAGDEREFHVMLAIPYASPKEDACV